LTPYYQDDAVQIFHGDCRDILPQLGPVDHVITDPPYARDVYVRMSMPQTKAGSGTPARVGVEVKGENWTKRQGASIQKLAAGDIGHIDEMLPGIAGDIARVVQRWAIVFSDVETCHKWRQHLTSNHAARDGDFTSMYACPMRYVRTGAWVKPDPMPQMSGDRPAVGFEPATICHALGPMRWNGGGAPAVWTHFTSKGDARPDHPCPKPLPLMVELVKLFSDQGDVILDPFGGSGTTGVAAKLNGRRCILIEKDERYAEVAAERLRHTVAGELFAAEPRAKNAPLFGEQTA
jgi:16S rRNA G966 N2-methylase RsmD